MEHSVKHSRIPMCISDPNAPDNPIVFVNAAFLELTGYTEEEVIGRNCRFLQGRDTTPESLDALRKAIAEKRVETVEIVNYRKDGTSFVNALQLGPIMDDDGKLIFFFGSQLDVTAKREAEREARELTERELIHRLRNIVNVMSIVIRMTVREQNDPSALAQILNERLQALSDAHFDTINWAADENLTFGDLGRTILAAYAPKGAPQFQLEGRDVPLPHHLLSCVALTLHELATNSVKHGALGAAQGLLDLRWDIETSQGAETLALRWTETGGPPVSPPKRSSGSKIIGNLITAVGGTIDLHWKESGLIVDATFPL
ncbi:PAS domain-containing protein [Pseudosulfitobacter koreensis]|uniref:histidine kinase n=1 Tax=Pseudosulfitobacter koreensis TaxID=2968472 RepID=A0ABT1Z2Y9_9RHOB|nr:PAS domain-containing protein [Pseudosulfitobacter koreense]MCR8827466.1 PAS domain-containing protein [Pseudosulfitobacter koreense]